MLTESSTPRSLLEDTSLPVERLTLRWHSARRGDALPFYEDVALGSLGSVAEHLALVEAGPTGAFRFLQAGPGIEGQVGLELRGASSETLAPNYRVALEDCVRRAARLREPVTGSARCVLDGLVATCDLLALPLANRWGGALILCYLRQQPVMHDLVDATYRSTSDGLLALASVAGAQGPDFQVVSLNGIAATLFGRSEADIRWQLVSSLAPGWGEDGLRAELVGAMEDQRPREFEYDVRRIAGGRMHLRISVAPVGDLLGVALTDVTEMRRREDWVRLLFESNPMPLLVYDRASLRIRNANAAMTRLCGYPAEELLSLNWSDLFRHEAGRPAHSPEPRAAVVADAAAPRTWRMVGAGGEVDVEIYANQLLFEGEDCVLASMHDVTTQLRAQAHVAYLAHHDSLTGLHNRGFFRTRLAAELSACRERGESLAVLCLDLDRFKQVNDTLGHQAGDELLRAVGERIGAVLGPGRTAARLGGDEFAAIVTGLSGPDEVGALAERLVARISAPYLVAGQQAVIGTSAGISLAPADGSDPDILLHNADIALYRSKSEGRGTLHFFEAGMDSKLLARRSLEADLRAALGHGELELFYQPIVDAGSLRILGFEALLRWFHPERGAVPPAEFIPIAEEIGAIDAISDWVLGQACAEAAGWPDGLRVAVNLSVTQFQRDLPAVVAAALHRSGLPAARLELEITESVFLNDSVANLDTLHRLRGLGVAISLDDFGTGYSSLAYLNRFPFDKIKIDRSFVRDLGTDRHGLAIVRAVISLGASLGIRTLAEGVETPDQLLRLREEGCTEIQGFALGRPLPAPRLPALLAERKSVVMFAAA